MAAALARAVSGLLCFVDAAVAQYAFLPATVRVAGVSELTTLGVHVPDSINIRVLALFYCMRRFMAT